MSRKESATQKASNCAFNSEVTGSFALKTTSYSAPFGSQVYRTYVKRFMLYEDISPITIFRNKRSGRCRPRSSVKLLTCSPIREI
jgi:hypothetical protein